MVSACAGELTAVGEAAGTRERQEVRVSLWGDKNVLKLDRKNVAQPCEYTQNCSIRPFKWVDFVVCELYFTEAVKIIF